MAREESTRSARNNLLQEKSRLEVLETMELLQEKSQLEVLETMELWQEKNQLGVLEIMELLQEKSLEQVKVVAHELVTKTQHFLTCLSNYHSNICNHL